MSRGKTPRTDEPTATGGSKLPPLKSKGSNASINGSNIPRPAPRNIPPSPPAQSVQKNVSPSPPAHSAPASQRTKKKKAENVDPWKESERLVKECEQEFGFKADDEDLIVKDKDKDWLKTLDELDDELNRTFTQESYLDPSILLTMDDAFNDVDYTEDIFENFSRMTNTAFDKIHENTEVLDKILDQRIGVLNKIRDEILSHKVSDLYKADQLPDDNDKV